MPQVTPTDKAMPEKRFGLPRSSSVDVKVSCRCMSAIKTGPGQISRSYLLPIGPLDNELMLKHDQVSFSMAKAHELLQPRTEGVQ
jgi:hypothetical protein